MKSTDKLPDGRRQSGVRGGDRAKEFLRRMKLSGANICIITATMASLDAVRTVATGKRESGSFSKETETFFFAEKISSRFPSRDLIHPLSSRF